MDNNPINTDCPCISRAFSPHHVTSSRQPLQRTTLVSSLNIHYLHSNSYTDIVQRTVDAVPYYLMVCVSYPQLEHYSVLQLFPTGGLPLPAYRHWTNGAFHRLVSELL